MPPILGQLIRNRKRLEIPLEQGDPLVIIYRPAAITPRLEARLTEFKDRDEDSLTDEEKQRAKAAVLDYFEATLDDWNLEYPRDDEHPEGGKVPPTREGIGDMFYDELMWLIEKIQDDQTAGEAAGASKPKR